MKEKMPKQLTFAHINTLTYSTDYTLTTLNAPKSFYRFIPICLKQTRSERKKASNSARNKNRRIYCNCVEETKLFERNRKNRTRKDKKR